MLPVVVDESFVLGGDLSHLGHIAFANIVVIMSTLITALKLNDQCFDLPRALAEVVPCL